MQRSYEIFDQSIKSEATRKTHKFYLDKFLEFSKTKAKIKQLPTDQELLEFVKELKG